MNFGRTFAGPKDAEAWFKEAPKLSGDALYRARGSMTPRTILHQPEGSEEEPQPQEK